MKAVYIGIDVSKKSLDGAICKDGGGHWTNRATNCSKGFRDLVAWALKRVGPDVELRFCMESTGDYGVECALCLTELGYDVSMVNAAKVKYYGIYRGLLTKSDKADAKLIADFARDSTPEPWAMKDPVRRKLFRLHRRRAQLTKMETAETNRRECPVAAGEESMASIKLMLKAIRAQIRDVERQIQELIEQHEEYRTARDLICSIPVLAKGSASLLLAEMPPVDNCPCAKSWAAAAGGHPTTRQTGTTANYAKMHRGGRKRVRAQLWCNAVLDKGNMPQIADLYERLRLRGRTHRQAGVACVRKLLMIVYGVLKSGTHYRAPDLTPHPI